MTAEEKLAQLEAQNAELQEILKRKEDETAKAVASVHEQYQTGRKPMREIPGQVQLTLVPTGGGKPQKETYAIAPGHPKVRLSGYDIVQSSTLMKLAAGEEVPVEEQEANPALKGWSKEKALAFLSEQAAKKAGWLVKVTAMLLVLLLAFAPQADAQIGKGRLYTFGLDTLTNADTIYLTFPRTVNDMDTYNFVWQVNLTNLSGTTAASAVVQESLFDDVDAWVNMDTVAFSGTSTKLATGTLQGVRQRLRIISTGTQSTRLQAVVRYRREE